jgi:hypothetical protein
VEAIKALLGRPGVSIDAADKQGQTPLMLAVRAQQQPAALALTAAGASLDVSTCTLLRLCFELWLLVFSWHVFGQLLVRRTDALWECSALSHHAPYAHVVVQHPWEGRRRLSLDYRAGAHCCRMQC